MLGVQLVADELEEPFGFDRDDLKLNRFCDVIRFQCFGILVPIFFKIFGHLFGARRSARRRGAVPVLKG